MTEHAKHLADLKMVLRHHAENASGEALAPGAVSDILAHSKRVLALHTAIDPESEDERAHAVHAAYKVHQHCVAIQALRDVLDVHKDVTPLSYNAVHQIAVHAERAKGTPDTDHHKGLEALLVRFSEMSERTLDVGRLHTIARAIEHLNHLRAALAELAPEAPVEVPKDWKPGKRS